MPKPVEMRPAELRRAVDGGLDLLIPVGAVEYHGGGLPLGTDLLIAEGVAEQIERAVPAVIAPAVAISPTGFAVSGRRTERWMQGSKPLSRAAASWRRSTRRWALRRSSS